MTSSIGNLGYSDMDGLALAVRAQVSRRLIGEAIIAYRGGALRSAIMSTWIAVAYDIISKARELAAQGEAAPEAFTEELDKAIENNDKPKLLKIESDLLRRANQDLQLLAPHEYTALLRLQEDRHLCAHPAFVVEDELYQPTPELVRAHIIHALQHLLVHAPLQGKSAIARFNQDLLGPAFPTEPEEIGVFMQAKYLDRAKDVLVANLIKAIFSAAFGSEREKYASRIRTLALVLREIFKAKTDIYDSVMPGYVAEKCEQIQGDDLLRICPFLGIDSRIWGWLKKSDQARIRRMLESADVQELKASAAFDVLDVSQLAPVLLARVEDFDEATMISLISEYRRPEFVDTAIEIFSHAGSFRDAESLGQRTILPMAEFFGSTQIKSLLDTVRENGQIWNASGTPDLLEQVFDMTSQLLPETRSHWEEFVEDRIRSMDGDRSKYYSYPGLQERLADDP
ncbi:MAG: hypothetical protein OXN16_05015 [Gammaproteobacteria bacterium]|nr:hypothetical protein [Gammaproteobacteria bacterium]